MGLSGRTSEGMMSEQRYEYSAQKRLSIWLKNIPIKKQLRKCPVLGMCLACLINFSSILGWSKRSRWQNGGRFGRKRECPRSGHFGLCRHGNTYFFLGVQGAIRGL